MKFQSSFNLCKLITSYVSKGITAARKALLLARTDAVTEGLLAWEEAIKDIK